MRESELAARDRDDWHSINCHLCAIPLPKTGDRGRFNSPSIEHSFVKNFVKDFYDDVDVLLPAVSFLCWPCHVKVKKLMNVTKEFIALRDQLHQELKCVGERFGIKERLNIMESSRKSSTVIGLQKIITLFGTF